MGCEVGAYVWMQEQCPGIRIPHLYGFGLSNGRCVRLSRGSLNPIYVPLTWLFRRSVHA
jgi:hypothetical protein